MVNKIKIGGMTYQVVEHPELLEEMSAFGRCNYKKQKIEYDPDQGDDCLATTLLHEAMHGLFYFLNFDQVEDNVECLANGLLMFIRDNPELIKSFLKGDEE